MKYIFLPLLFALSDRGGTLLLTELGEFVLFHRLYDVCLQVFFFYYYHFFVPLETWFLLLFLFLDDSIFTCRYFEEKVSSLLLAVDREKRAPPVISRF